MKGLKIRKRVFSFSKAKPKRGGDRALDGNGGAPGEGLCPIPEVSATSVPVISGEKKARGKRGSGRAAYLEAEAGEKLLESFRTPKNAELEEEWKRSENSHFTDEDEDTLREMFVLTRAHLKDAMGPLSERSLKDDATLGKALEKIHRRLPLSIRLIFWKKRYVQFILENRDRLIR